MASYFFDPVCTIILFELITPVLKIEKIERFSFKLGELWLLIQPPHNVLV